MKALLITLVSLASVSAFATGPAKLSTSLRATLAQTFNSCVVVSRNSFSISADCNQLLKIADRGAITGVGSGGGEAYTGIIAADGHNLTFNLVSRAGMDSDENFVEFFYEGQSVGTVAHISDDVDGGLSTLGALLN